MVPVRTHLYLMLNLKDVLKIITIQKYNKHRHFLQQKSDRKWD